MAKGMQFGINGVAKKILKMQFGVGNVPKNVKAGWIGVGGLPKLMFSSNPSKVVSVAALSVARKQAIGASNNNYALFGAGESTSGVFHGTVDAYNTSLTRSTPNAMMSGRLGAGASSANWALMGGVYYGQPSSPDLYAYNTSLTRSIVSMSIGRHNCTTATVGDYMLFAGGTIVDRTGFISNAFYVDAFNASLVRSSAPGLGYHHSKGFATRGANTGIYTILTGGTSSIPYVYSTSLVQTVLTTVGAPITSGATCGAYALITTASAVYAYNSSLVQSTPSALSVPRSAYGIDIGDSAIFAGGGNYSAVVDVYNASLVRSTLTSLSVGRTDMGGAKIGNTVLFAGGSTSSDISPVVDGYAA